MSKHSYDKLFDLAGRTALVIGTGGIGSAIAKGLAEYGASVIISDVNEANLNKTAQEITQLGNSPRCFPINVDARDEIKKLFAFVREEAGKLDILVNSAGIGRMAHALDITQEDWDAVVNHFLSSVFWCCQEAARLMVEHKGGKILNICSMSGIVVTGDMGSSYAAAKAGLIQLTKALGTEWAKYKINVNAISPGFVRTALTEGMFKDPQVYQDTVNKIPLGRVAEPSDMVGTALFLCSSASDYLVGQNIVVDGGYTCW